MVAYERSLFGFTSVSFVNTSFGSVPDIYLSIPTSRPYRQPTRTTIPNQTIKSNTLVKTFSSSKPTIHNSSPTRSSFTHSPPPTFTLPLNQSPLAARSVTSALQPRSITTLSSYTNNYHHPTNSSNRPVSSSSAYQNHTSTTKTNNYTRQQPDSSRNSSPPTKSFELTHEYLIPTKTNTFRTVKYVPSSYNRYRIP